MPRRLGTVEKLEVGERFLQDNVGMWFDEIVDVIDVHKKSNKAFVKLINDSKRTMYATVKLADDGLWELDMLGENPDPMSYFYHIDL